MRAALAEASPRGRGRGDRERRRRRARAPDAPRRAILGLVSLLAEDFAAHENPNRRKGGLLGLAAVVVGLGGDGETGDGDGECVQRATRVATSEKRLVARAATRAAVPPVLAAFCDLDARVRYYACEAMYNIVKTARGGLLLLTESVEDDDFFYDENGNVSADSDSFLRRLFDAACDLSADADADVQNAAHLLDGLVKDVVSEAFHDAEDDERVQGDVLQEHVGGSRLGACLVSAIASRAVARESENVLSENDSRRSPVRGTRRRVASSRDPYARQFLIGWIVALDATPQMDALRALPEFFDGLLLMLSDPNREIRAQADGCLRTFLTEIKALFDADKGAGADADARRRRVDVARLSATLERHTRSADEFTRVTAVTWLREFVALAGRAGAGAGAGKTPGNRRNEPRFPEENDGFARVAEMTRAVLPCLSHAEAKVRDVARARRRGAARGGARRRRRGDAGPGRAPLRARGVRRSADGLPRRRRRDRRDRRDRRRDSAESRRASRRRNRIAVVRSRRRNRLWRNPSGSRADPEPRPGARGCRRRRGDARGGAALVPRAARDGARGDEDADAFEDSED